MEYLFPYITLMSITLLAAMSPGPDMIVVVKNSLLSRRLGIFTALGIASAIFIHVGYCIAGVGVIISQSIILFSIIKMLGALYILYIAYQLLRAKRLDYPAFTPPLSSGADTPPSTHMTSWQAYQVGVLTNILNPKVTVFFLAVFTQVISPESSFLSQLSYGTAMSSIVGFWFVFLACSLTIPRVQQVFARMRYALDKVMGAILALVGAKILFSLHR